MTRNGARDPRGISLVETLVVVAIIAVVAAVAVPVVTSFQHRAHRERTAEKLRGVGEAFMAYSNDNAGLLPWEDAPGTDDWDAVANEKNAEVWYNALPRDMGFSSGAALAKDPALFYEDSYPLFLPGAPYPEGEEKLEEPHFAIGMNSRLQRKNEAGDKIRCTMSQILNPEQTVIFLERGMKDDKMTSPGQKGFNGTPKANARAFVARYNGTGMLIFADGHIEVHTVSELITPRGLIPVPQTAVIWTNDPDDDPN